jgi:hypothetical protein
MHVTVKVHLPERLTVIGEDRLKVELPDGSLLEEATACWAHDIRFSRSSFYRNSQKTRRHRFLP